MLWASDYWEPFILSSPVLNGSVYCSYSALVPPLNTGCVGEAGNFGSVPNWDERFGSFGRG